jgi:hypothetical protein
MLHVSYLRSIIQRLSSEQESMSGITPTVELATAELLKPLHRPFLEHFATRYMQDPMLFAFHSGGIALLVMHELDAPHIRLSNDEAISALKHAIAQVHERTVPSVRPLS